MNNRSKHSSSNLSAKLGELAPTQLPGEARGQGGSHLTGGYQQGQSPSSRSGLVSTGRL